MPLWSTPSSSSRSDRIIPFETSPRSFACSSFCPSGRTAPGSATATVAPAPKFQALQTVGIWMLAGLHDLADEVVLEIAVCVRDAALDDAVDLAARDDQARRDLL